MTNLTKYLQNISKFHILLMIEVDRHRHASINIKVYQYQPSIESKILLYVLNIINYFTIFRNVSKKNLINFVIFYK